MAGYSGTPLFQKLGIKAGNVRVYVGTYTRGRSKGIYLLDLDLETGALRSRGLAAKSDSPSFLAVHPSRGTLYAVNSVAKFGGRDGGGVSAFRIDPNKRRLKLINSRPSLGAGPCYVALDSAGRNALVSNYAGGSVAVLPIDSDGSLGEATAFVQHEGSSVNPKRQEGPHAHSMNLDAGDRFALAADLGADKVFVYRFDPKTGTLAPNDPAFAALKAGAGPRHLTFHPGGTHVYVVNELDLTVTVFSYDAAHGVLSEVQTVSTLPGDAEPGYSTAEIRVHPTGRFLYASNRGHDTIAVFAIDPNSGELSSVEHAPTLGRTPRHFAIDPAGRFLLAANQDSDSVVVFRIDQETGGLTPTGETASVPSPVCIRFVQQ
ncbi:MAG TPA: lactonase family protein [Rhodothermales bacterium]|nr:lactonase family protein [Rhodothermales bacterium]